MNSLTLVENKNTFPSLWDSQDDLKQIKEIYGRNLSSGEFNTLVQLGKATGLNPFLKEIWAVKYGDSPAQIFVGRDGYRRSAQRHPLYDYHIADSVYANDTFEVTNGEVTHKYSLQNRGALIGAYCTVKRKGASKASYVFVELKEYSTNRSLWSSQNGKPSTMIKKVAEAQGLRAAFQELFSGTYSEFEAWEQKQDYVQQKPTKGVEGLKNVLGIHEEIIIEQESDAHQGNGIDLVSITFLMESASTLRELKEAAKLALTLSAEEKKEARIIYKKMETKLKGEAA